MTVLAHCTDCNSSHPVGDRVAAEGCTACPECGSRSYSSSSTVNGASEGDVASVLLSIDGVGHGTLESIEGDVGTLTLVPSLSVDRLTEIDGVGKTVAKRIVATF